MPNPEEEVGGQAVDPDECVICPKCRLIYLTGPPHFRQAGEPCRATEFRKPCRARLVSFRGWRSEQWRKELDAMWKRS
jgi:hypothetical protein